MKRNKLFLLAIASVVISFVFTSCSKDENTGVDPGVLNGINEYGIYEGSTALFELVDSEHQMYLKKSSSDITFRFLSNDGSKYMEFVFDSASLSTNSVVSTTITDSGFGVLSSKSTSFKVISFGDTTSGNKVMRLAEEGGSIALVMYWI